MQDMAAGTTSHVVEVAVRSNLKRSLITTIATNVTRELNLKHDKWFSSLQFCCNISISNRRIMFADTKIKLEISDPTAAATCVLFDKEAQIVINDSSGSMITSIDRDSKELPKLIQKICGQTLIFQFRLTEYNLTSFRPD